ncbi:transcriptional regulator [Vibrio phage 209E38-1]
MNIEVVAVDGIPMASSKNVAEKFGKQHRDLLVKIRKIIQMNSDFGERNFSLSSYISDQNKELPCYNMTRDGFTMLAMELSGKKVFEWKIKYIEAFNAMESRLLKETDTLEWKQARLQGKQARRSFTDVVKEFVQYATDQGSKSASMYYMNITKMEYAALELTEKGQKTPKDFRETLDCMDLCFLASAEQIAKNAIKHGIDSGMYYKEIYKLAKDKVFTYSETVKLPRLK